jgi:hypothetical protein
MKLHNLQRVYQIRSPALLNGGFRISRTAMRRLYLEVFAHAILG